MATFTVDLISGNIYLFSGNFSGTGGTPIISGTTYPEVLNFASLPAPSTVTGEIYMVRTGSGSYPHDRKDAGFYYSVGGVWVSLPAVPEYFKSDNFKVYDSVDHAKGMQFITSGITAGTFRKIKIQNLDGTLAYLTDLNTKVDTSVFNTYVNTTAPAIYATKLQLNVNENYEGNGIISGFTISINTGLTSVNITSGVGYIVDNHSDPNTPIRTKITYSGETALPLTYLNSDIATYLAVNSAGVVIQQPTIITAEQRRDNIIIGVVIHSNKVIVNAVNNLPDVILDSSSQFNDLLDSLKNFNVEGNVFGANGNNLQINKSIGKMFKRGVNFAIDNKNPHVKTMPVLTAPSNLRYRLSNGQEYGDTNSVSLYYEDPMGTRTPLPTTGYTVQRIVLFATNLVRIQYGQSIHSSMSSAFDSIFTDQFVVERNMADNGLLRGYLIINGAVTSLQDQNNAMFIELDKFGSMPLGSSIVSGLQQITEINAETNIETIFSSGIITNKIRPNSDSTTALQIHKADGITSVIDIDTVSGFTGHGTVAPKALIHTYGIDNSEDHNWNYQTNAIRLDGSTDTDKDIQWFDNGVPAFTAQIFRNEGGRYWYLSSPQGHVNQLTVSETGRVGVNNQTNIMNYHALLESGGPNDLNVGGFFTENYTIVYNIEINSVTGLTDTFRWRKSLNEGETFGDWQPTSACTSGITTLEYGVTIGFENVTGHVLGSSFIFAAFAQLPVGTFVITPNRFHEVQQTLDYSASAITYTDITAEANASNIGNLITMFNVGVITNAIVFGTLDKLNSIFVNLTTFGSGVSLITEYWNGSSWINLTLANNSYHDDTNNLTQNGAITWETDSMNDWIKTTTSNLNHYEYYWLRLRTSTNPTIAPIVSSFARNGKYRIAVLSAPNDFKPSFYVDSIGRTSIGGGNITGGNVLQVNKNYSIPPSSAAPSLVEIDSEDSNATDLKLRLASNDNCGTGIVMGSTRGTLNAPTSSIHGDELAHVKVRALTGGIGYDSSNIETYYLGDGVTTKNSVMILSSSNASGIIEGLRLSGEYVGFGGVTVPSARIHVTAGSATIPPLKFNTGVLTTTPQSGAVEFDGNSWHGTVSGDSRCTFAFLESPLFTGAPNFPVGTTLNSQSLCNYILVSGGSNNTTLTKTTTFNSYINTTAPATYTTKANFGLYTGTTAPATYTTKDIFNAFTGATTPVIAVVITGVTNGITKSNAHVAELGGNLSKNTVISGNTFDFTLSSKLLTLNSLNGICLNDDSVVGININSKGGNINIRGNNTSDVEKFKLLISDTQATLTDSRTTPIGIVYDADYSANFTARSLVDKAYVDANSGGGVIVKQSVVLATTGNTGLSGLTTIDGILTTTGMRILVKNQATAANNGVYSASTGTWGRVGDFNQDAEVVSGSYFFVNSGSTNAKTAWVLATPDPITVGVTSLTFTLFSSSSGVVAGNGICVMQLGGNYNVSVKNPLNSGLCIDSIGTYINPAIAGIGLCYNAGVMCVSGGDLAGNSIIWSGNTFNVNTTTGTLSTALNGKANTTTFNIFTGATQTIYNNTLEPTGFVNNNNIIVTYNKTNRTITLNAGAGTIQYYWRGVLHDLGTTWTSTSHTNNTLAWYLYSTDGVNINWSTIPWEFTDLQVASRPANVNFAMREVHGMMPNSVHEELHDTVGTYVDSGFGLTDGTYMLQPTVPVDADNTPAFLGGIIQDEDLHTIIAALPEDNYTLAYFTGSSVVNFITGSSRIFRLGSTYPKINIWNGTIFSETEMLNESYANWYVFRLPVTADVNSQQYRLFITQPQYQYPTLISAQSENISILNLDGIKNSLAEYVPVERITLRTNSGYTTNGKVRIEAIGELKISRFGQIGSGFGTSANNISVTPIAPFTGTNMQILSDEYASAITAKLTTSDFNTFTGTTLPAGYYCKSEINLYTGATQTKLNSKAFLSGATFTGIVIGLTPSVNDNSTRFATTAYYIGQCGRANPLMNNNVAVGTSALWAHQDHVHPKDTAKAFLSGATFTGAVVVNSNLTTTGTTILRGTTCLGTLAIADITTDRTVFRNPTSCALTSIKLTGGSDSYFYTENTTLATSSAAGLVMYLSGTPWTFKAGRYQIDFDAQYGNTTNNGITCTIFAVDGVTIGTCYQNGGQVANWVSSASLSRDITVAAGCHCLTIQFARGANTSCMTYGMIRAKRIC